MRFILDKKPIFLGLLFLSSCISMSKEEQRQNILCPPALDKSLSTSLSTPFFTSGEWPSEAWWEIFDSEQLNSLVVKALVQNPSIQSIEYRVELAKQTATVVRSKLFPLIFFDATDTWQHLSHNGLYRTLDPSISINANLIDLTMSFTYEFDFWGKNRNLFQAAVGRQKAEEAEAAQVQLITSAAVTQGYFALKTQLVKKRLYEQLVDVRRKSSELQTLLQEKALFSKLPPLLSEENVLEAEKLLLATEEEIATTKHLINVLVGVGPDEPLDIDDIMPTLPKSFALPETLSIDLLARRPDLMAQIWRVESLAKEVGAAKADFFPNINLTAFGGVESIAYSLLFNSSSETIGMTPAIHLPIFTAGAIRANVRAKKASFDEAVYEYNQLILRSSQEVADFLVLVQTVFEQKEKQNHIVANAKARYDLTALRQAKGLDNLLQNYAFEEALIQKEIDNVNLLYTQYLATIKLIKALGGGYTSEYSIPLRAEPTGGAD